MPFANIVDLNDSVVQSTCYFADANVWIYSFQREEDLPEWQRPYSYFFYSIVESELDPLPKILMPTLLFSEILSTYLRQIAMPEYKIENNIDETENFNFKKDYRPTSHYRNSYERVCDDISGFRHSLIFVDDKSLLTDPPKFFEPAPDPFDFNDYIYYQICKDYLQKQPLTILTNDGDFQIEDIPIVTANRTLLRLR